MDPSDYAREVERYLCRKNDGHLIRIVGPAFEQVCGWAMQGIPLKVAFRGIDNYFDRYYAKGRRRRPVRIEFCEADVLDAFDAWRRAVGVPPADAGTDEQEAHPPRKPALAAHVERVIARLANLREKERGSAAFVQAIESIVRELEPLVETARGARGDRRAEIVERLARVDETLREAAHAEVDAATEARLRAEVEEELAPFGARLTSEAREQARKAAYDRLVREALGLPTVRYD